VPAFGSPTMARLPRAGRLHDRGLVRTLYVGAHLLKIATRTYHVAKRADRTIYRMSDKSVELS
jgi:hypothetical protein